MREKGGSVASVSVVVVVVLFTVTNVDVVLVGVAIDSAGDDSEDAPAPSVVVVDAGALRPRCSRVGAEVGPEIVVGEGPAGDSEGMPAPVSSGVEDVVAGVTTTGEPSTPGGVFEGFVEGE